MPDASHVDMDLDIDEATVDDYKREMDGQEKEAGKQAVFLRWMTRWFPSGR